MKITIYIISQVFTVIAYIFIALTYHAKSRRLVLKQNCISQISFIIAFSLLKAWSGLSMAIAALLRNIIFMINENKDVEKKNMSKIDKLVLAFMFIICIISAIFTYEGIFSLFPIIATMIYSYTICQKNIKIYKMSGIVSSILYLCYGIYINSIFEIILETIVLINTCIVTINIIKSKNDDNISLH